MRCDSQFDPIYLVGPTCSGKSSLAISLATRIGGEVVNADAYQIYQGLDRLTAKPSRAEREMVSHHLYGVLPIHEECQAGRYQDLARDMMRRIAEGGRTPIVVGGSGLYLKSLTHGLPPLPPADPELRARLEAIELEVLVRWLATLDPRSASEVDRKNRRYVSRALEITLLSGVPASRLRTGWSGPEVPEIRGFSLQWERQELVRRIALRSRQMFENDEVIREVEALDKLPRPASATASKAIGVREIRAYLRGESSREECIERVIISTRQYAKRQATWFRREKCFQTVCLPSGPGDSSPLDQITAFLSRDQH